MEECNYIVMRKELEFYLTPVLFYKKLGASSIISSWVSIDISQAPYWLVSLLIAYSARNKLKAVEGVGPITGCKILRFDEIGGDENEQ